MAISQVEIDLAIRLHLSKLAKDIRTKFSATAYQGDYENTVTGETFGDRLQVGTRRTIGGTRYLFVLNFIIASTTGGKVSARVSTWNLSPVTGLPVGHWSVGRTELHGVTLTSKGFNRRLANTLTPVDMLMECEAFLNLAGARVKANLAGAISAGSEVQVRKGYSPSHELYGETYDSGVSHLLVFGGLDSVGALLSK